MQLLREFVDTRLTPGTQKYPSDGEIRSYLAMQADAYREYAWCLSGDAATDGTSSNPNWSAEEEREINDLMDELSTALRNALRAAIGRGGSASSGTGTPSTGRLCSAVCVLLGLCSAFLMAW